MKTGFLGLGTMGSAMAANLIKTQPLLVFNRSKPAIEKLVDLGATEAESAKQALSCKLSFSMLANDAAADEVLSAENITPGTVHVGMASISPEMANTLTKRFSNAGATYISAPVLGRPQVARDAALNILAGGDAKVISEITPVLETMGKRVWFVGNEPRQANLVKIAVNYNILHAIQALAESVALIEKNGMNGEEFVQLLSSTLFGGVVYKNYGEQVAIRNYQPVMFSMDLGRKDLQLAQTAADESGIELPTAKVLAELMELALTKPELASQDWAAMAELTLDQDQK